MANLLIKNIGLLATPMGTAAKSGSQQGSVQFLYDAFVRVEDGIITEVGSGNPRAKAGETVVDACGKLVTPGLVDAHTHLIFGGWRQNELGMKLHGKTYLEIQNAGGGIQSSTNATRQASEEAARHASEEAARRESAEAARLASEEAASQEQTPEETAPRPAVTVPAREQPPIWLLALFLGLLVTAIVLTVLILRPRGRKKKRKHRKHR
jgi:imidazolonepropionase